MRSIRGALVTCLLAVVFASSARADDAAIWTTYSGGDATFVKAGSAALRACHAVGQTRWRDFAPLIAAERHRGRVIHRWALRVRAEKPSSAVGADGRDLALKGLSAYGRMSRAFVAAFRHANRGDMNEANRYRAQGSRWARRAVDLSSRAHQTFRSAGYKDPPPPHTARTRRCDLHFPAR